MNVIKCDKCNKKKSDKNKWIHISISGPDFDYGYYDLCEKCSSGILNVLKKNFKASIWVGEFPRLQAITSSVVV